MELPGARVVVGRDQHADLRLEDTEVSRRHASFTEARDGRVSVEDLGSRNGTFVDGRRIVGSVTLSGGERVKVGQTVLAVASDPASAGSDPVPARPTSAVERERPTQVAPRRRQPMPFRPLRGGEGREARGRAINSQLPAAVLAVSSVLLLLAMLLPWFTAGQVTTPSGTVEFTDDVKALLAQTGGPTDFGASAWQAFAGFDALIAIVAVFGIVTAVALVAGAGRVIVVIAAALFSVMALATVVLILVKMFSRPDLIGFLARQTVDGSADLGATAPSSVAIGVVVALLASLGCLAGAGLALTSARPRP